MFRSLMVPLDGSQFGEHALPMAHSIARRAGASLELVRVHQPQVPVSPSAIGLELLNDQLRSLEEEYLAGVSQKLSAIAGTSVTTQLIDGLVAEAITAHVSATKPDLVVMTTHGRGPLSRFWLGSVADKLLRQLTVPVLLIRPSEQAVDLSSEPKFHRLLIPLDGSEHAERILDSALQFGGLMNAEYTLLRIVDPTTYLDDSPARSTKVKIDPAAVEQAERLTGNQRQDAQNYLDATAARLRAQGLAVQVHVISDLNHASAILKSADAYGTDLVAMATQGSGGLKRMLLGSVADKVVRGAKIPVLVHNTRGA